MKEAQYYQKQNSRAICYLCPHTCELKPGERGKCRIRKNIEGKIHSTVYGKPNAVNTDPIEKKPLYHFLPGKKALSIGTAGCNHSCTFCQNWRMSQKTEEEIKSISLSPEEVVKEAQQQNTDIIAYTYNEPTVFFEYMQDIAKKAREKNIKNVAVTCGLINQKPLEDMCKFIDAANIDLKYFSDQLYREISGGYLKPVLNTIKTLKQKGVWIEITNLIIPGLNDTEEMITEMCNWIVENIGEDVPLHLSRFHPAYKMQEKPPTPIKTVKKSKKIAKEKGINHVYIGNVPGEMRDTECSKCGSTLIERRNLRSNFRALDPEKGRCSECGTSISGVWQ